MNQFVSIGVYLISGRFGTGTVGIVGFNDVSPTCEKDETRTLIYELFDTMTEGKWTDMSEQTLRSSIARQQVNIVNRLRKYCLTFTEEMLMNKIVICLALFTLKHPSSDNIVTINRARNRSASFRLSQ